MHRSILIVRMIVLLQILCEEAKWLRKALSQDIDNSVIVINTGCTKKLKVNGGLDGKYPESEQGTSNIWEGALVGKLIALLLKVVLNYYLMLNIGVNCNVWHNICTDGRGDYKYRSYCTVQSTR